MYKYNEELEPARNNLIGSREAAKLLNISDRKLWELRSHGKIKHCRIGRKVLFSTEWITQFIESRSIGGD